MADCGGETPLSGTCLSSRSSHPLIHKISNIWGTICWPAVTSTHGSAHSRVRADARKHTPWRNRHTHTHTDECWHTVTHTTLRELKSAHIPHLYVPWLFSITTASLRWCICDIWRRSLYSLVPRYHVSGREKKRRRERKTHDCLRWQWESEKKEQDRARGHLTRGTNTYSLIGKWIRAIKPQALRNLQQKAWVPPSGHPAAIWYFMCWWSRGAGGATLGCHESIGVRGQPSWVAVTSWQWDTSWASETQADPFCWGEGTRPLDSHTFTPYARQGEREQEKKQRSECADLTLSTPIPSLFFSLPLSFRG